MQNKLQKNNKLLQQHLASTCFNLEKTRLTFSGDYTLIVSKAYFISFKYQNINYNQSQFKTKLKNKKITLHLENIHHKWKRKITDTLL